MDAVINIQVISFVDGGLKACYIKDQFACNISHYCGPTGPFIMELQQWVAWT